MDTDRLAQFVSTVLIFGVVAFIVVPNFGFEAIEERLLVSAAVAVVVGGPVTVYVTFVRDEPSYMFGPWDVEDLVFLLAVIPGIAVTVWIAEEFTTGPAYWVVIVFGLLSAGLIALVVRDATVGEWPPGSKERRKRREDSPGDP